MIVAPFESRSRVPQRCLLTYAAVWIVLAIQPWDRGAWALENLLPLVIVPLLAGTFRRFRFSDRAYVQVTAFMVMHCIGSHYTYARTPIGAWLQAAFDAERNDYDRLVHFAFGLLWLVVVRELVFRPPAQVPLPRQLVLGVAVITAGGAVYELLEWWTAIVVDPEAGTAFLGTQGDAWDAQKDMWCALVGAVLGALVEAQRSRAVGADQSLRDRRRVLGRL